MYLKIGYLNQLLELRHIFVFRTSKDCYLTLNNGVKKTFKKTADVKSHISYLITDSVNYATWRKSLSGSELNKLYCSNKAYNDKVYNEWLDKNNNTL